MHHLGQYESTFAANMRTFYILLGVGCLCTVVALLAFWMGIDRYYAPPSALDDMSFGESARSNGLIVGVCVGLLNTAVAMGCFAAAWFQKSVRVEFYSDGLLSFRGTRRDAVRWDNVATVEEYKHDAVVVGSTVRRRSIWYSVTVKTADDREVLLRGIEHVRGAGERIAKRAGVVYERSGHSEFNS